MFAARSIVVVSLFLLSGCITGNGRFESRTFEVQDFEALDGSHAVAIEVTRGDTFAVSVSSDDNLWDHVMVVKEGNRLKLGYLPNAFYVMGTMRVQVTMPKVTRLELSGSSVARLNGFDQRVPRFDLLSSGASGTDGTIAADVLRLELSGSSRADLDGSADQLTIEASGASGLDLRSLPARTANVHLSGSSTATISVEQQLDYDLSGASRLTYAGNPNVGVHATSGESVVAQR